MTSTKDLPHGFATVVHDFGETLIIANPTGVVRVIFNPEVSGPALLNFEETTGRLIDADPPVEVREMLKNAAAQIEDFLSEKRTEFFVPLDFSLLPPLVALSKDALLEIPTSGTLELTELAKRIKKPRSHKRLANELAENPLPLLLPCHRVIDTVHELEFYVTDLSKKFRLHWLERSIVSERVLSA